MALALRVVCFSHGSRWPQDSRRLMAQLSAASSSKVTGRRYIVYRANYSTQTTQKKVTPPQIKRNVAAEITSVGKVLYDAGWDPKAKLEPQLKESEKQEQPAQQQQVVVSSEKSTVTLPTPDQDKDKKEVESVKTKREQMRDNMQDYIFTRYFNYVKNYDKVLEKNFPKAMQIYRAFFVGVKEFFSDMKRFLKIARIANDSPQGIRALNRQELELYMQMPRDMMKVAPALIGCSLPMVGYAFFPLVFWYPRVFLTSHFWTPQQRIEFQDLNMMRRLQCNKPVLRCLQAKLKSLERHHKYEEFRTILGQLGSGTHPSAEDLIAVKDIFAEGPYSLLGMTRKHVKSLLKMHGLPNSLFKRHRLHEHAFLVHYMDMCITREGGVHNLSLQALRYSCYLRGLNPNNMSSEDMIEWLRTWVKVSTSIQGEHITLFLHLPILLGYNHPNNWKTIYSKPTI